MMATPNTIFTCDQPDCRSTCELSPVDAARDPEAQLRKRGWTSTKDSPPKHFCLIHVFQGVDHMPTETPCTPQDAAAAESPCGAD